MNKNAIQKYAVWARRELIEQINQRAYHYGIREEGYDDENAMAVNGRALSQMEIHQRRQFIEKIKERGYWQAVEEVAYTWFNRFVALRFMEVNDYLPTHIRVLSNSNGEFKPEILKEALHIELEGLDRAKVSELLNANAEEALYRYLLLTQCNALNAAMPEIFEKMGSYTEMLLPDNILKPEGIIGRLVLDIPEEDWKDAVQIIGWMYQYYNTEPKQAVFNGLKKNIKITKEKIPAATQLFTPDWIVRYMVENSLGRLWLESHPNDALKANWKYYLDEAEQPPEVAERLRVLRAQSPVKSPEDIKLIDPCMGSGHILVYAFDVLMQIYESEGYNPRDAAQLILEKNLYGLDIDERAYQLAYFALMMKARQYDRRILTRNIKPQVYHPAGWEDGEEYGSLVKVDSLGEKPQEKGEGEQLEWEDNYERDLRIWNFKRLLAQKYDVVVTNPPYMGSSGMNAKLSKFVKKNYPDGKSDLFAAFIERGLTMIHPSGFNCMVTMQSWMFLSSFKTLRTKILNNFTITNLLHMENMVMGIAFGTAVSNLNGVHIDGYKGRYNYVTMADIAGDKPKKFPTGNKRDVTASADNFAKIPGSPVAYWVSDAMLRAFEKGKFLGTIADAKQGIATSNNDMFLRLWYEVDVNKLFLECSSHEESEFSAAKWYPYNKGGNFRKWYGNNDYVVNWQHDGEQLKNYKGAVLRNPQYYFKECISWSKVTSGGFSMRYVPKGSLFDVAGCSIFSDSRLKYLLGLSDSVLMQYLMNILSQTLNYEVGTVKLIPIIFNSNQNEVVEEIVNQCISLSRTDWDSFETSWDFKRHPMICPVSTISEAYEQWKAKANEMFDTLKSNEEELNRIFIDIYGLQDELTPDVADKDVTVHRIYDSKEDIPESMAGSKYTLTKQDVIKSFISYAVGCMFGRYSLDVEGLAFAGGEWNAEKYKTFLPDEDNIIPICDDEYFEDDIVGRFVKFVSAVYGEDTLEENLRFIADALGGKGTPREVIRSYFLNGFYKDHCKTYKKRPIYWLFDSGKKNGFKALTYMHRYSRDLLAKLRTDYVHEQQERYRTQLAHIEGSLDTAKGAERARLLKQQNKLMEQLKETTAFEEKVHHLADQNIEIDLDDGVKHNYAIFADVLAKI